MKERKGTQFNCFSPPVMLATLVFEIFLAVYTLWRYKLSNLTRLIAIFLLALATFQLAEFHVCTGAGSNPVGWSKLGFVAITTLPPMGLHLMHMLANKPNRRLVMTAYATMLGFCAFFLLAQTAFAGHKCTGNYVIYQFSHNITGAYSLYYYGWILAGIGLGVHWANELKDRGKAALKNLEAVRALIVGYLVFLIPTGLVNSIKPETRQGIPSIMCGFAVLLAFILGFYILPRMAKPKVTTKT